ncbi:preprotein translocase subunit SecG [Orbaceae bacterium ESL0727]|nr:preprotein translocase subunit SecG [Orbaceae bacterium ESL0727]
MYELLIISYLIIALAIVILVLIQRGKGADMGSSFGAGASATLFGSSGSGNFLTRSTTILGVLFFVLSIVLANMGSHKNSASSNQFDNIEESTPAVTQQNKENSTPAATTSPATKSNNTNPTSDIPE